MVPESVEIVPDEFKAIPRFAFKVKLLDVSNVPPPNANCPAVALPGAVPKFASALISNVPALIVVEPL